MNRQTTTPRQDAINAIDAMQATIDAAIARAEAAENEANEYARIVNSRQRTDDATLIQERNKLRDDLATAQEATRIINEQAQGYARRVVELERDNEALAARVAELEDASPIAAQLLQEIDDEATYRVAVIHSPVRRGRAYRLAIDGGPTIYAPASQTTIVNDTTVEIPGWVVRSKGLAAFATPLVDLIRLPSDAETPIETPIPVERPQAPTASPGALRPLSQDPALQGDDDLDMLDGPDELTL